MSRLFGWSLPPGVTQSMIDGGREGPLDCPVCCDGKEMDGPDCTKEPEVHGVTCKIHGCVFCNDLEIHRVYCHGTFCGGYVNRQNVVMWNEKTFCSQACADMERRIKESECIHGVPKGMGDCAECDSAADGWLWQGVGGAVYGN